MSSLPYMQLYVSDYLADTAHLTAQQHGAYMLLLMNYWQKGKALDNSNERLQFVARLSQEEWAANKGIFSEFFQIEDDIWWHARIEVDLEKVREKSVKASFAGKRSQSERSTNAERTLNHKDKDKDKDKDKETTFDAFWEIYPRKVAKQDALKCYERALRLASAEEILAGAQRFANDPNRIPGFTPHPTTWLNQGRWSDEPLPAREPEKGALRLTNTPTPTPPRYDPDEAPQGVPMPDSVRELLGRFSTMSDLP